jgi:PKD domain-containing protein
LDTPRKQLALNLDRHRPATGGSKRKKPTVCIILVLAATIGVLGILPLQVQPVKPSRVNTGLTNCGTPTLITLSQLESLTNNTIIPDKRSLTPPCTITYNGKTYPTYVELDGVTVDTNPYTGDCNAIIQGYCDVHFEFSCTVSAGCLFEIDQTWFAAGYTYPVNTQGAGSISQGTVINATGFLYIDEHGIHELHPTVSVSVVGGSPPATCSNGAIDPPGCATCPSGYVMQNGTCVVQPVPLSTSFMHAPTDPSINSATTFTATTVGGTGPYTVNWSFGDGATGIGDMVTHIYTSSGSFTVTDNVTDSSVPSETATRFYNITVLGNSNGGSTTGPGGGCSLCGVLRQPTTLMEILVVGGAIALTPLLAATIRSRSELQRVKRRLQEASMPS